MTLFWLVRHGAYPLLDHALGGRAAHGLSDAGREQAARVAAALAAQSSGAETIAALVSSPVERARQTAAPIGERLGLPVQIDPDFTEIEFAGWTGVPLDALDAQPAWQAWNSFRGTAGVPGGETMLAVQTRAMRAMLRWAAAHPHAAVAVVSHADVIKAVLSHLLGAPLDLLRRLEVGPGSISRVRLLDSDALVLSVNQRP